MSQADPAWELRRILVALDASPDSLGALAAAVRLARQTEAALEGLFVEDTDLLSLAESPFAREIGYHSAKETALSRASMERKLHAQSELARKALERAAQEAQVPWSFRIVRGDVTSELLAAAAEADLLAMGQLGWSIGSQLRIGSTALELMASTTPLLLSSSKPLPAKAALCAYYDGSPAAKRAFRVALQLAAAADSRNVLALVAAQNAEEALSLREELAAMAQEADMEVQYVDMADVSSLLRALRSEEGIFVIGGRDPFKRLPWLEAALRAHKIPLLLLRNGFDPETT